MNRLWILFTLLIPTLCNASNAFEFTGRAYDVDTHQLVYIEQHQVILNEYGQYASSVVKYVDPQGEPIALKQVSYEKSLTSPSFRFHNLRQGDRLRVDTGDTSLTVTLKQGSSSQTQTVNYQQDLSLVVDAGFDRFIVENWQDLMYDKESTFSFLAVTRQMLIDLDVSEVSRTANTVLYSVEPSNFFLKFLVDPIQLTYQLSTKRLLRFEGVTNIEKVVGGIGQKDNYVAYIEYDYLNVGQ